MIDTIRNAIRDHGGIDDYRITETVKSGAEWYFVGRELDTARSVETRIHSLTVYVDGTDADGAKTRGAYSTTIPPTAAGGEVSAAVARAARAASGMRNPWYPVPGPGRPAGTLARSRFEGKPLPESLDALRASVYAREAGRSAKINSLELYLARKEARVVNSRGLDVSWNWFSGYAEFIVNAAAPGREEVELFGDIEFSEPDHDRIAGAVGTLLRQAEDRLAAVPTPPADGLPVLFRGEEAAKIYGYWFEQAKALAAYEKTAAFSLGDDLCAGAGAGGGDLVELVAVPELAGNAWSRPYDADGVALEPVRCVQGGLLSALVGPLKYTAYLDLPATGDLPLFELGAGTAGLAELEAAPHLEASSFSDFFVDETTGDFGGELRLGYLVRDGERLPVRGGSVTGNLAENRGLVRLSRELGLHSSCRGPAACLVPKASITPAG